MWVWDYFNRKKLISTVELEQKEAIEKILRQKHIRYQLAVKRTMKRQSLS